MWLIWVIIIIGIIYIIGVIFEITDLINQDEECKKGNHKPLVQMAWCEYYTLQKCETCGKVLKIYHEVRR
jgi:hypothetical protein